ncbi:DNA methyltransferase [Halocella sp. SP3-1]|uniref:site-specific DNA-methyltransferase n=1 Tax=Halocella sp. SP3-1 TaxID=2382161 RepID=UPI000F75D2C6|nr:DNA methyltransferase [Halocella sp. SP3-1]AZO94945.1 site-specific DNA-methyltransferase [Halocella sp. SP3-1]
MEKLDPKADGSSMDIVKNNIEKLKSIFPDVFNEGQVDIEKLKERLGEFADDKSERYNLTWHGKSQAKRLAQQPSTGSLRPCKEESKDWDTTENLYIEGDNLEVLKLLQKSYHNKIKIIYIDPPYNTGKDFVYNDDFKDNLNNYFEITGQFDNEGNKLSTNSDTSGRYHTDWLNMIYPRLRLARNLMREDGVIFISIDDNEIANLKKICDEIYGDNNFISSFIWQRAYAPVNMNKYSSTNHDYILAYAKNIDKTVWFGLPRSKEANSRYINPDNDQRGPWKPDNLSAGPVVSDRVYEIVTPSGRKVIPPEGRCWILSKKKFQEYVEDNMIWFGEDGNNVPALKRFLSEVRQFMVPLTVWTYDEVSHSQDAKKEVNKLFDGKAVMDYPKPVKLMQRIVQLSTNENDIIMDFFSGSATMAHAVMQQNIEDNSNRKFIMVQLPENTGEKSDAYKAGYNYITDIGKERIRRAGEIIKEENKDEEGIENLDTGFKVFKLATSNIKTWDTSQSDDLEQTLFNMVENIKEDRTEEDIVYEILLKYGLDLTIPIEETTLNNKKVYIVGYGALIICLDKKITLDIVEEIGNLKDKYQPEIMRVIFKDNGFKDDVIKTNAIQILKKYGIEDVKSL